MLNSDDLRLREMARASLIQRLQRTQQDFMEKYGFRAVVWTQGRNYLKKALAFRQKSGVV